MQIMEHQYQPSYHLLVVSRTHGQSVIQRIVIRVDLKLLKLQYGLCLTCKRNSGVYEKVTTHGKTMKRWRLMGKRAATAYSLHSTSVRLLSSTCEATDDMRA